MEYLQKHWYIVVGALVLLFFVARKQSPQMTQIGGANADTLALAQISAAERDADENRRFSAAQSFLQYDLSLRNLNSQDSLARINLGQQIDLAQISANTQLQAFQNQIALASLNSQTQLQQYQMQTNMQNQSMQNAYNTQVRNDWISAISSGMQTLLPMLFGNATNNSYNNTPLFGGSNGGWIYS